MYINMKDEKRITDILDKVQKGYKVRLVTYQDIQRLVKKADNKLRAFHCDYEKCYFTFVEYVKCNSYSKKAFKAYSTYIEVKRGRNDWFLTTCTRLYLPTHRHTTKNFQIFLTPKILKAILKKQLKEYGLEENNYMVKFEV